jgi:hypothetical protein
VGSCHEEDRAYSFSKCSVFCRMPSRYVSLLDDEASRAMANEKQGSLSIHQYRDTQTARKRGLERIERNAGDPVAMARRVNGSSGHRAFTLDPRGIAGQSFIDPNSAFAKSWILRVLSFPTSELYPKVCILTSLNPSSCGSHFSGQKRDRFRDLVHVLREAPPKPWTNTRSANTGSGGSDRVVNPKGPFESSESKLLLSSRLTKVRVRRERFGAETSII